MSNKRQVFVTLHYRDELSLGKNRQRLGYAAYHWGILISPKVSMGRDCYAYDVSDGARPDPVTRVDHNPNRNWVFRANANVHPLLSGHLLGMVMVGKVPNEIDYSEIEIRLRSIPLPQRDAIPEQTCVTWVMSAVQTLQDAGLAEQFDLDKFMVFAIGFADQCMGNSGTTDNIINYTSRKR